MGRGLRGSGGSTLIFPRLIRENPLHPRDPRPICFIIRNLLRERMAKTKESKFESSLATLEQIVTQLESGELPLERALELFEEGVGLARRCQSQLEEVERKVELLLRERGEIRTMPFDQPRDVSDGDAELSSKHSFENPGTRTIVAKPEEAGSEDGRDDVIPF